MKRYLVTFDLLTDNNDFRNEDYSAAENYLQSFELFVKPTRNVYLVGSTNASASDIRDVLKKLFKTTDNIFVVGLDGVYASFLSPKMNERIREFYNI